MKKIIERSRHGYAHVSAEISREAEMYAEQECRKRLRRLANSIEMERLPQELRGKIYRANIYAMFGLPLIDTSFEENLLLALDTEAK